uniref:Epidermal differentiation protein n=1 Tax=Panagrolaimus davidi TaxID=227884 RepID=A0A914P009_9BILA
MGHCHSRPRCHSDYGYYGGCEPCEPCHPCEPLPRIMHGYHPCRCHFPQIIMHDRGGYGRKNNFQEMCQCGGYVPENRFVPPQPYYPQAAPMTQMPPYPPAPINPSNYIQHPQQTTPYPSPQQQQIPINNYPPVPQQTISKPQQSSQPQSIPKPRQPAQPPRSSSPPPPYS